MARETRENECMEMKCDSKTIKKRKQRSTRQAEGRNPEKTESKGRDQKEVKNGPYTTFLKVFPAESLSAEQPQSWATSGLPCIHFTAQALRNDQTNTVTLKTAAVRLPRTPLHNKPKLIQLQAHANVTQCISVLRGRFLSLSTTKLPPVQIQM